MARVFLTGGSGLVGGALLERLLRRGDDVVALARSDETAATLRARGARIVRGDVLDEDTLVRGMDGSDLVFHVAGVNTLCPTDPRALLRANVEGAAIVVRAAARAGVPRLVNTSSAATIGELHGTVGSETAPHRGTYLSVYERSKHQGEIAAFAAGREHGIEVVAVNPSSVQGPGRAGGTGRILLWYLNGRLPAFVDTWLSLVDIDDCAEGHLLAAEHGHPGERYVVSGATLGSLDALKLVTGLTGVEHRVRILPRPAAMGVAALVERAARLQGRKPPVCREMVRTLLHGHRYDGSRAAQELGLGYTPIEDTFARTIAWAIDAGLVTAPLPAFRRSNASAGAAAGTHGTTSTIDDGGSAMERHDESHEHPARPEQTDSGFAEGIDRKPDPPEEEQEPDFARGARTMPADERRPRFSEGAEEQGDTPDKTVERRFSEGSERSPTSE